MWLKKYWRYPTAVAVIGYLYLIYRLGVPCLFRSATGVPCPGCGMSRAVGSLLRLPPDIPTALSFHPLVVLLPLLLFLFLTGGRPFGSEKWGRRLLIGTAAAVGVWYAVRLVLFFTGHAGSF